MAYPWKARRAKRGKLAADRIAVCRLIAGLPAPVDGDTAAGLLGWPLARWWAAVFQADALVTVTGRGWVLTKAGRALAEEFTHGRTQ